MGSDIEKLVGGIEFRRVAEEGVVKDPDMDDRLDFIKGKLAEMAAERQI